MKKVFIFGYYGFRNIGDEAILHSIVKILSKEDSEIDIKALSYNVKYTESYHDLTGVSRNSLRDILSSIKNADLVVSGGGTLLQDKTSSRSLYYYLALILVSKLLGKKVIFFCNGFGPINNSVNRVITKQIIKHVDKMIIRDEVSSQKLLELGLDEKKIITSTDATLILDGADGKKVDSILEKEGIPKDKKLMGISLRPWTLRDNFYDEMAYFADYAHDRGYYPVFVPMQFDKDNLESKKVIEKMKKKASIIDLEYSTEDMLGIIKRMDILVGMRLHALIFACNMKVPVIGLEYDPKIDGFLKMVNQANVGDVYELDRINLCLAFDELTSNYDSVKERLSKDVDILKEKAEVNGIELIKML